MKKSQKKLILNTAEPNTIELKLEKARLLSDIINTTCDFEEFVSTFKSLISTLEFLSSYENDGVFSHSVPSNDLSRILENKPFTEKEFIDRHVAKYGKDSLENNRHYLNEFTLDSVCYFAAILKK